MDPQEPHSNGFSRYKPSTFATQILTFGVADTSCCKNTDLAQIFCAIYFCWGLGWEKSLATV